MLSLYSVRNLLGVASCLAVAAAYISQTDPLLMRAACVAGAVWFLTLFVDLN